MTTKIINSYMETEQYNLYEQLSKTMEAEEGRRSKAYQDTKQHWTIGVGHKIKPDEQHLMEKELTDAEIDELKHKDITQAIDYAKYVAKNNKTPFEFEKLPIKQQVALVEMVYQLGIGSVMGNEKKSGFPSMLRALAEGNYKEAGRQVLIGKNENDPSQFLKDTPNRAKRVSERMASSS